MVYLPQTIKRGFWHLLNLKYPSRIGGFWKFLKTPSCEEVIWNISGNDIWGVLMLEGVYEALIGYNLDFSPTFPQKISNCHMARKKSYISWISGAELMTNLPQVGNVFLVLKWKCAKLIFLEYFNNFPL